MSLRIRHLKLISRTLKADYEADLTFPDGLVLFHVRNTSGKSTALKSIIYALGLEKMFGPGGNPPLTPAMTSEIQEDGSAFPVVESFVILEIENHENRRVTLRRRVKGEEAPNWKLIEVWENCGVADIGKIAVTNTYYVRDEGSATREQGFFPFLAKFVGWELPEVIRFDGPPCPLYMECLLPLFYVEQSHGWTAIQATTPKYFGIRQVEKKALEFLLALDSAKRDTERQRLEKEELETKAQWTRLRTDLDGAIRALGGALRNIPIEPTLIWPPEQEPFLEVFQAGQPVPLSEAMLHDREALAALEAHTAPNVEDAAVEIQAALSRVQNELSQAESYSADVFEDLQLERSNLEGIETRSHAVRENLEHNLGNKKLRDMGATTALAISKGRCPTCERPIADTLLPQIEGQHVMTLDENIEYLRAQEQTLKKMGERTKGAVEALERKLTAVVAYGNDLKGRIRSLKRTLLNAAGTPSEAAVRERLLMEQKIERREMAVARFDESSAQFTVVAARWKEIQERKKALKRQETTAADEQKRRELQNRFIEIIRAAGFDSFSPEKITIESDSFRPMREGFDIVYDVSASDNIRSISSYLTALLEVARLFKTNHPGLLILDEPRQQNLDWTNFASILERLAQSKQANQQVIVATSDPTERIAEFAKRIPCTHIALDGKILKKVPRNS